MTIASFADRCREQLKAFLCGSPQPFLPEKRHSNSFSIVPQDQAAVGKNCNLHQKRSLAELCGRLCSGRNGLSLSRSLLTVMSVSAIAEMKLTKTDCFYINVRQYLYLQPGQNQQV